MAKIFIQISSYRDPELKPTILDAIGKSSRNHELYFGLHISYLDELEIDVPDIPNIKYVTSKAPKNIGVGIGRYIAHQFYNGQDFYLQCDSHTRFVENWDEIAINSVLNYQAQGIKKPLLTMYPANYWYTDETFNDIETDLLNPEYKTIVSFHQDPDSFKNLEYHLRLPCQQTEVYLLGLYLLDHYLPLDHSWHPTKT